MVESSVQSTLISDGYAAFNNNDWQTVRDLLCDDEFDDKGNVEFPLWERMEHDDPQKPPIRGKEAIIELLQEMREDGVKAKLLGVADHGHTSVTLDISTGGQGPHACADEVEFDASGRIKIFRHCVAGHHNQAGSTS